ncbi:16S rRNA methyltransferase [[Actinobacillus] muris]|uniref:Ribosomal RNA small subunit methyltransferase D n=1 Tax=Muribacter muris TaxID=67855 RepID=A0A0J5P643_9PAST|nr:16S rRNA (guanine(966)-N(2))-methyltransferase RsmD [Muribacter muris]KMK51240.1 16S rRNA methyltransferase [[Actinobacillus] muris] [Muribacter muris]
MKKSRISPQNRPNGEVRVIGGRWRGRKLPVLNAEGLRPTTDRVKETLFNWLMMDIAHAHCLDCFAGSGSLGIEALSRQAQAVTFLEKFATAADLLAQNLKRLAAENGKVVQTDSLAYLAQANPQVPFDIVFVDPPFHQHYVPQVLIHLARNGWLAENALIYVETEKDHPPLELPSHWQIIKEKTAGQVVSRLIRCE